MSQAVPIYLCTRCMYVDVPQSVILVSLYLSLYLCSCFSVPATCFRLQFHQHDHSVHHIGGGSGGGGGGGTGSPVSSALAACIASMGTFSTRS
jgi:hypothetical protein